MEYFSRLRSALGGCMTMMLVLLVLVTVSEGQVQTSITPSALCAAPCGAGATFVNPPSTPANGAPTTFDITGGARPSNGRNLFHSFDTFSVGARDKANFLNDQHLDTTNIISRVTGGQISNIYGTLQTTGFGNAALWLVNPAGIVMGPTASLNVGGAVHLSTADYLRMSDGARFFASLTKGESTLSSMPVAAFGFLSGSIPQPITVESNGAVNGFFTNDSAAPLPVTPIPHSLSLVGGDISITGRTISTNGGAVNLVSVASAGEVAFNTSNGTVMPPALTGFTEFGKITLSNGASIDTSTTQSVTPTQGLNPQMAAGAIYIRGGQLELDASSLKAISRGYAESDPIINVQGGDIIVTAEQATLSNQSLIQTGSDRTQDGGNTALRGVRGLDDTRQHRIELTPGRIEFNVGNLLVKNSTFNLSSLLDGGKPGSLVINGLSGPGTQANSVTLQNSVVGLDAGPQTGFTQNGGDVEIHSSDVLFNQLAYSSGAGDGKGGDIRIQSTNKIDIQNSDLGSASFIFLGNGGTIALEAGKEISLLATTLQSRSSIGGGTGDITLTAPTINMRGGKILTESLSLESGNITFNAGTLNLSALQTGAAIQPAIVSSSAKQSVTTTPAGTFFGNAVQAGNITVQGIGVEGTPAPPASLVVLDNSTMSSTTNSKPVASFEPSNISIRAQNIELKNGSEIKVDTTGGLPAGNITLRANDIRVIQGSRISASSSGDGKAGDVNIFGLGSDTSAARTLMIDNSTILTSTSGGNADAGKGSIKITAETLDMRNTTGGDFNALVTTTSGAAPAGDIVLNVNTLRSNVNPDGSPVVGANRLFISAFSQNVEPGSAGTGSAGTLTISGVKPEATDAAQLVAMYNTQVSTGVELGKANSTPGTISVTTDTLALSGHTELFASAFPNALAPAGNVNLHVNTLRVNVTPEGSLITEEQNPAGTHFPVFIGSTNENTTSDASRGGTVTISGVGTEAANLIALNNAKITTTVRGGTADTDRASIQITTNELRLSESRIAADTTGATHAGSITLNVGTLSAKPGVHLLNEVDPLLKNPNLRGEAAVFDPTAPTTGNVISSSSTGAAGRAGEVRIQGVQGEGSAASSVSFERSLISTAVSGGSSTNAPATIDVAAQSLALSNGAVIRADTTGETPAGDITFHVGTLRSNVDGAGSALVGVDRVTISSTSNSSGSAGAVAVRGINGSNAAGSVSLSETDMSTASLNGGAGGSIIMNASGPIALTHSTLSANVNDGLDPIDPTTGRPGSTANITLTAPELTIQGGGITAQTNGTRNAGTITLNTDALTTGGGTKEVIVGGTPTSRVIISSSSTSPNSGAGNAGNVDIRGTLGSSVAGSINLQSTDVSTEAKSDGAGGPITIAAQGPITLLNSNLSANVVNKTGVSEEAANVTLTTGNQLTLNSGNLTAETTGTRDAGAVIVNASSINISNGGRVSSSSIGNATGSAGRVTLQGNKGPGSSAETISLNNGEITTEATGGSGGSIALNASGPVGLNNSTVSASVRGGTDSSRPKADIAVAAGSFSMNGGAITVETNGAAHAGDVTVNVGSGITLANGARISSSSTAVMPTFSSPGNAGSVTLTAGGQLHASGATVSSSAADGQGGIIEIQAGNLVMDQGTTISASTTGLKNAGNINLTSTDNIFITNSTVTTSAAQASGGDIKLTAPNTVRLVGANLLSDVQGNKGSNGGNISIDPQFVIIQGGSVISASASTGAGGKINIEATQAILMEAGAEKNIKATGGNPSLDGQINIQAPIQQLAGAIAPLPQAFAVASNLYGQRCAAQKGGQFSSFVQGARDGIPPQPGDLISSPLAWEAPGSTPNLGLQPVPSLAAIRLGLPEIDYHKLAFMTFSGCRS